MQRQMHKTRCLWAQNVDSLYQKYHDNEWGKATHDEHYIYMMFILECFQAGLSWKTILHKREAFKKAFDQFDIHKIAFYDNNKIEELMHNKDIIRHRLKIKASINNSQIILSIMKEYGSFSNYLWSYTNNKVIYETNKTQNHISDKMSYDLKKRGMKFVGSVTIYSFMQAIGIINSHEDYCQFKNDC